ncbi:MAG TPA: hypothetical protein VFZ61_29705, partial [Polyangiales bacterium]
QRLAAFQLGFTATGSWPELAARIAEQSQGNPLVVRELSRGEQADGGRSIEHRSFDSAVLKRISKLSSPAQAILELLAVAGRPIPLSIALHCFGLEAARYRPIRELRDAELIQVAQAGRDELLEIDHLRLADVVRLSLTPARKRQLHMLVGQALDAPENPYSELAISECTEAQLRGEAAKRAEQAGHVAMAGLAFARAVAMFRRALELGDVSSPAARAKLLQHLAVALEHSGAGREAATTYARAAVLEPDRALAAQLHGRSVQLILYNASSDEGRRALGEAYRHVGLQWPRHQARKVLTIVKARLGWGGLRSEPRELRGAAHERALSRVQLLTAVGTGLEGFDPVGGIYNVLMVLRASQDVDQPSWRIRAQSLRGLLRALAMLPGGSDRGIAEIRQAYAAATRLGDLATTATVEGNLAGSLYMRGDLHEALLWLRRCEASYRLLPLTSDELQRASGFSIAVLFELGHVREAAERWALYADEAKQRYNAFTAWWLQASPVQFAALFASEKQAEAHDRLRKARELGRAHPDKFLLQWTIALCEAETALYWGTPGEAMRSVRRNWASLWRFGYVLSNTWALLLRVRCALASLQRCSEPTERSRLARHAKRDLLRVRWAHRPSDRCTVTLLHACLATLEGKRALAERTLAKQLEAGAPHASKLTAACTRYGLGTLRGGSEGAALRDSACSSLAEEGIQSPLRWIAWSAPGFVDLSKDRME